MFCRFADSPLYSIQEQLPDSCVEPQVMRIFISLLYFLFIYKLHHTTDNRQMIILIIIAQLIYLMLVTYFRHRHHVKVDKISTRKDTALTNQVLEYIVSHSKVSK